MKTTPITSADLARSIIAVPPLCRDENLRLAEAENERLIRHLEGGGVRILLYGGNANLYHIAVSEYGQLLDFLEASVGDDTLVIPSVGPMYGTMMDQAALLRERAFPAAMVLPTTFPATVSGIQTAVRHFVETSEVRAVIYIKDPHYITPEAVKELVDDGLVAWVKYALVRDDPSQDPYLDALADQVDPNMIVSGIGEQPAIVHVDQFKVIGFTSGCVCVAPRQSMNLLEALKAGKLGEAEAIRERFKPLEDLRNGYGPIPVLHHAVAEAGIAETGPPLPYLSPLEEDRVKEIGTAARALLEWNAS